MISLRWTPGQFAAAQDDWLRLDGGQIDDWLRLDGGQIEPSDIALAHLPLF